MALPTVEQRFAEQPRWRNEAYNFAHFGPQHGLFDAWQLLTGGGVPPGALAPDFELPRVGGGTLRLSALRDKPVLLHFGSYT